MPPSSDCAVSAAGLDALLAGRENDYRALCELALENQRSGHFEVARRCYEAAERRAPPSPELAHNLGLVCRQLGDVDAARACFERASVLNPNLLPPLDELALLHQESGNVSAALTCYEKALRIDPHHARAFVGMGMAFSDAGWEEDAVRSFLSALEIDPAHPEPEALNGLAVIYKRQGRYEDAIALLERALALCPDNEALQCNIAMVFGAQGESAREEAIYRQLLARNAENAGAHFGLASVLLLTGQLAEGWREYEWRFVSRQSGEAVRRPPSRLPRWNGEAVERTSSGLIVYAEQGFGDNLQFVRLVHQVAARFGRVRLQTRRPLLELFRANFQGIAEVVAECNDEAGFTHHCPLLSVPLALGLTLETIPAEIPYLRSDAVKCAQWRQRLAGESRPKVGIVWATGKRGMHKRSFELSPELLEPLLADRRVCWVNLNKVTFDPALSERLAAQGLLDWSGELADFSDTAALVDGLDLVISVDTAVAHLAGALGRPVWLLNRVESDWRWLKAREDSPWYPTMRIFRQQQSRQWSPVVQAVAIALKDFAERVQ